MEAEYNNEVESDIVDQHCHTETEPAFLSEDDIPPRPSSRLSFNRNMIDSPLLTEEETTALHLYISEDAQPSRRLLRAMEKTNMDGTDMDITTFATPLDNVSFGPLDSSLLHGLVKFDDHNLDTNEGEDDMDHSLKPGEVSCSNEDEQFRLSLLRCLQPTSASPDCEMWALRPKYSCLPSPLSPLYNHAKPYSFQHTPLRHIYRQHGYSRHALLHLKWFWTSREEEWTAHADRLRSSKTNNNLAVFRNIVPTPILRYPGRHTFVPPNSPQSLQENIPQLPPMSVHPRRGDILTLRDPYCMHIDRFFVGLPLWTMGKMLWMYDVHIATETRYRTATGKRKADTPDDDTEDDFYEEEQSEGDSIETMGSADSSDDSDATLVESESEGDLSQCVDPSNHDTFEDDVEAVKANRFIGVNNPSLHAYGSPSIPPKRSRSANSVSGDHLASLTPRQTQTTTCPNAYPRSSDDIRPPWITCWYQRWDLLAELVRDNANPFMESHDPPTTSSSSSTKPSKFYLADDESWRDVLVLDDDNSDVGNSMVMPNPLYDSHSLGQAQCPQV